MSLFRSATTPREDQAHVVGRGNSAVSRLVRFMARTLLWGCVLLLIIRGILSELNPGPQAVTTTRGAAGSPIAPSARVSTTGGATGAVNQPAYPAQAPEGK